MIVYDDQLGDRDLLFAWLHGRTAIDPSLDFRAIGYVNQNLQLIGVVGYNTFIGKTALIHFATDDPAAITRGFVRETFRRPYEDWGIDYLLGVVNSHNVKAMTFDLHLGFREVHRIPGGHEDGGDLVFLQMDLKDCRWLRGSDHGREETTEGAGLREDGGDGRSKQAASCNGAELREQTNGHDAMGYSVMDHGYRH